MNNIIADTATLIESDKFFVVDTPYFYVDMHTGKLVNAADFSVEMAKQGKLAEVEITCVRPKEFPTIIDGISYIVSKCNQGVVVYLRSVTEMMSGTGWMFELATKAIPTGE